MRQACIHWDHRKLSLNPTLTTKRTRQSFKQGKVISVTWDEILLQRSANFLEARDKGDPTSCLRARPIKKYITFSKVSANQCINQWDTWNWLFWEHNEGMSGMMGEEESKSIWLRCLSDNCAQLRKTILTKIRTYNEVNSKVNTLFKSLEHEFFYERCYTFLRTKNVFLWMTYKKVEFPYEFPLA